MVVVPKVFVLILSYNGKHLLGEAISSYLANDYRRFEVVVIDNGSTDGTESYVNEHFSEVRVLRIERNTGYSGGFNAGLSYAFDHCDADYSLITNNDVKADRRLITEFVKVAETDEDIGFVVGKVYYYDNPDILQTVGKKKHPVTWNGGHIGNREKDRGQYDAICERYFADDICTLVSRRLYHDTGGYDLTFFLQSEDYDWQARSKKLGYRIMYTPYAKLWHKDSMTIGRTSPLKAYYDARNPMLVVLIHKSPRYFRKYIRYHLYKNVLRSSLVAIKSGAFTKAYAKWFGFFSGIMWGIRQRMLTLRHFV